MSHRIRKMIFDDLGRVFSIEKVAHITPWSKKIIHDCIEVGYGCFVIEKGTRIQGFMIARAVAGECHLLNLCIHPNAQGRGLGEALLLYLIEVVKLDSTFIQLEVRPSNQAAIELYEKHGFDEVGRRKDYYSDKGGVKEDALVFELRFD